MNIVKVRLINANDKTTKLEYKIRDYIGEHAFEGKIKEKITTPIVDKILDGYDEETLKKFLRKRKCPDLQDVYIQMQYIREVLMSSVKSFLKPLVEPILSSEFSEEEINNYFETEQTVPSFETIHMKAVNLFKFMQERAKLKV